MKTHAAIVIRNDKNEILFVKRSMMKKTLPGIWSFPSGTVEEGESSFDTAVREAKEELNIDVKVERLISSCELPELNVKLDFILCSIFKGQLVILDFNEIERFEWMSFNEFFNSFNDSEIGHGLIWLRKNMELLGDLNNVSKFKI